MADLVSSPDGDSPMVDRTSLPDHDSQASYLVSLPDDVLFVIFNILFAQVKRARTRIGGLKVNMPALSDGLQLLLTCRRMRDFGRVQWVDETAAVVVNSHGGWKRSLEPELLELCPWGAAVLIVKWFHQPRIVRKMCQKLSFLLYLNWFTNVRIHIKSDKPVLIDMPPSDMLSLLEQNEKYRSFAKCWMRTVDGVTPEADIRFKVVREVCCEDRPEVVHIIGSGFVLSINNGKSSLARQNDLNYIYSAVTEHCTCREKYEHARKWDSDPDSDLDSEDGN